MGLFCEHSDVYSETFPVSGMTRGGTAYELPTSEPHTDDSGSLSLLQTPSVADSLGGHLTRGGDRSDELLLPGQVMALLPTPNAADGTGGPGNSGREGGLNLRTAAVELLPTPRATDGTKGGPNQRGSSGDLMLPSAVHQLLPTPTAMDSKASGGSTPADVTLTDAVVRTSLGAHTNPRFDDGSAS